MLYASSSLCTFVINRDCPFSAWVELEDTYELSAVTTLQDAVNTILKFLGLAADTGSGKVNQGVHTHTLLSSGK